MTLPDDLAPDERATVEAFRRKAARDADERAALAVRVERERKRLEASGVRGRAMLQRIAEALPVTEATARRIVYRQGAWAA